MELDLTVGNPGFLQDIYTNSQLSLAIYDPTYATKGKQFLIDSILNLHKSIGNVSNIEDYTVVIGNGATQLVDAVIKDLPYVYMHSPYWARFSTLTKEKNIPFYGGNHTSTEQHNLVVYPNNPDFSLGEESVFRNVDACYHWPHYYTSSTMKPISGEVMIFSLAKLTGLASTRIGWALVRDAKIAERINHHVEISTSGVSIEAQIAAYTAINNYSSIYKQAKDILAARWELLCSLEKVPTNSEGMFALYYDPNYAFEDMRVKGVRGKEMGIHNDYIRFNIGCSEFLFQEFIKKVKNYVV